MVRLLWDVFGNLRPLQGSLIYCTLFLLSIDWIVRLCDVWPDGRSMSLCRGGLRARYRNSFEKAELIEPGQSYEFGIDLAATAQVFKAGHRLRVHVTSSEFPVRERNMNTGGANSEESVGQVARNTVFHDAARASHLVLPVMP